MATRKKASKKAAAPLAISRGKRKTTVRHRYPFNTLKRPGDYFSIKQYSESLHASLRTQASKQGQKRGVKFAVNKIRDKVTNRPIAIRVQFEHPQPDNIEVHTG